MINRNILSITNEKKKRTVNLRMRRAWHVVRMGERIGFIKVLVVA
jgi:hypothetical protein